MKQRGFGILELLISLILGMIMLAAVLSMFSTIWSSHSTAYGKIRLAHEMRYVMTVMSNDLRRAGTRDILSYDGMPALSMGTLAAGYWSKYNPFGNITILDENRCVLFGYDLPPMDDTVTTTSTPDVGNESMGFRLNITTGQVESRVGGTQTGSCAPSGNNYWSALTGNDIKVTGLIFTQAVVDAGNGSKKKNKRYLSITMTAQMRNDARVTNEMSQTVYLRNDEVD